MTDQPEEKPGAKEDTFYSIYIVYKTVYRGQSTDSVQHLVLTTEDWNKSRDVYEGLTNMIDALYRSRGDW